ITSELLQRLIDESADGENNPVALAFDVASAGELSALIGAVNGLADQPVPAIITAVLSAGVYADLDIQAHEGISLVLRGGGRNACVLGHSPAPRVPSGVVSLDGLTLTTNTNSATVLVSGGTLVLRNSVVEETATGTQSAVFVSGGTVDLGASGNN